MAGEESQADIARHSELIARIAELEEQRDWYKKMFSDLSKAVADDMQAHMMKKMEQALKNRA